MVQNADSCFPKPKMTSSNISSNPQPQESQLTVIEEERNHNSQLESWKHKDSLLHKREEQSGQHEVNKG